MKPPSSREGTDPAPADRTSRSNEILVRINGQRKPVPSKTTISDLIHILELDPHRLAIELNHRILKRGEFARTHLADGDELEIVHFVGGG